MTTRSSKLWSVISEIGEWNWTAVVIGVGSLLLMFAHATFRPQLLPAALDGSRPELH